MRFSDYPSGEEGLALMVLAHEDWNIYETRRELLATLGEEWAERGWKVYCLRLATAAWMPGDESGGGGRAGAWAQDKRVILIKWNA